jgi:hypothetical protein
MFSDLKCGQGRHLCRIYRVNGQLCYLAASKVKDKEGKPELQIIISFNQPEIALISYKKRWQIETAFKGLKSSGFNIENTHLTDLERIEKLFTIVILAFTRAYIVGVFINDNIKPIRVLKHGRKAKSFLKYGLQFISRILLNPYATNEQGDIEINIFKFLSCT